MSKEQRFMENCKRLNLKKLSSEYSFFIEKAQQKNMGFYEFLEYVIEQEAIAKIQRTIAYRIKQSKLPIPLKLLSDFDFEFQPSINRKLIMDLSALDFIGHHESILFIGDCGTGKSYLAQALALNACQKEYRVFYATCAEMITDLNIGVYEKTLNHRLQKYINCDLLVIDEMGHDRLELEVTKEAHLLFKVIDERYKQKKSLIFTTNVEQEDWADYLGDPISTRAILDRIFHHSLKIEIRGRSYREYEGSLIQDKYEKRNAAE